jgi:hypothetical protein
MQQQGVDHPATDFVGVCDRLSSIGAHFIQHTPSLRLPPPPPVTYHALLVHCHTQTIVTQAITNGLPLDANGVYFVLTSADTTAASGFCTLYCGALESVPM